MQTMLSAFFLRVSFRPPPTRRTNGRGVPSGGLRFIADSKEIAIFFFSTLSQDDHNSAAEKQTPLSLAIRPKARRQGSQPSSDVFTSLA